MNPLVLTRHAVPPLLATILAAGCGERAATPAAFQGYAEGEYVRVAAPFAGALQKLAVARGSQVARGAPLFVLEQESEAAARREAEDRLARAQAQLENLQKGRRAPELDVVRAQLLQAEEALRLSDIQLKRQQDLVRQNFISRERLDEAASTRERDLARVAELKAQLASARLAARPDEIRAARADMDAARAVLEQADWRLKQKTVTAPADAAVADTLYVEGEWVNSGAPVVSLLPPANIKARFFVPQAVAGGLAAGREVVLECDGCAGPIAAKITWIAPQAEYTPPVIYNRENRAKLVFMVEARPAPADAAKLRPGQPLDVRLK
jgi:HlyD family secretion protein